MPEITYGRKWFLETHMAEKCWGNCCLHCTGPSALIFGGGGGKGEKFRMLANWRNFFRP